MEDQFREKMNTSSMVYKLETIQPRGGFLEQKLIKVKICFVDHQSAPMMKTTPAYGLEQQTQETKHELLSINRNLVAVGSDKPPCPREVAALNHERVKCESCHLTEALMKIPYAAEPKCSLKLSEFKRLHEEYIKWCDPCSPSYDIPPYLDYVAKGIGRHIAAHAVMSFDILVLPRAFVYAAIDEMHNMQLKDIINDENVLLKWGSVIKDSKLFRLDVEFLEEHVKKITHAYFQLQGEEQLHNKLDADTGKQVIICCSMSGTECFDDGAPLSKGILPPPIPMDGAEKEEMLEYLSKRRRIK